MKKTFAVTAAIQAAYILLMVASILLMLLQRDNYLHSFRDFGYELGMLLLLCAWVTPVMPVCLTVNTVLFCSHHRATDPRKKWQRLAMLILPPVMVTVVWVACGVLFVEITGGV